MRRRQSLLRRSSILAVCVVLGGPLLAVPFSLFGQRRGGSDSQNLLHVLVTGSVAGPSQRNLWHTQREPDRWQPWADVEAAVGGDIGRIDCLASSVNAEGLHLVACSGGAIWHTLRQRNAWQNWGNVTSAIRGNVRMVSQIAVAGSGSELHIVALAGGRLLHTIRRPDGWQNWGDVEAAAPGSAGNIARLAAAATPEGVHILALGTDGPRPALWHTIRRADRWEPWGNVEGAVPGDAGQIAGVASAATMEGLHVIVAGTNSRGQVALWHTIRSNNRWQEWGNVGAAARGNIGVISQFSATGVGENELHLVVVSLPSAADPGRLWHTIRRPGGWQAWGDVTRAVGGSPGDIRLLTNGAAL
jgi:hypothetical protein